MFLITGSVSAETKTGPHRRKGALQQIVLSIVADKGWHCVNPFRGTITCSFTRPFYSNDDGGGGKGCLYCVRHVILFLVPSFFSRTDFSRKIREKYGNDLRIRLGDLGIEEIRVLFADKTELGGATRKLLPDTKMR